MPGGGVILGVSLEGGVFVGLAVGVIFADRGVVTPGNACLLVVTFGFGVGVVSLVGLVDLVAGGAFGGFVVFGFGVGFVVFVCFGVVVLAGFVVFAGAGGAVRLAAVVRLASAGLLVDVALPNGSRGRGVFAGGGVVRGRLEAVMLGRITVGVSKSSGGMVDAPGGNHGVGFVALFVVVLRWGFGSFVVFGHGAIAGVEKPADNGTCLNISVSNKHHLLIRYTGTQEDIGPE